MGDRCGLLLAVAVVLSAHVATAQDACRNADGSVAAPVALLVSFQGEVLVDGAVPPGKAPQRPLCAGTLLEVGPASRALVHLVGANTSLRLDENSLTRVSAPPEPGWGLVDLLRGGLYFLSEVRRTLTVRTPYANAGVEGTEVYLRTADAGSEMIVLEGRVAATPGAASGVPFAPITVVTGQQLAAAPGEMPTVTALPDDGSAFGVLRRVTVGALSWTLYYPEVLVGPEAATFPRIGQAARLLVAGRRDQAEAVLAQVPAAGDEGGLSAALRTSIAVAGGDAAGADREARQAIALAPDAAAAYLAQSYARQLSRDLDGALAAAADAAARAPDRPLPQARLAELYLMQGAVSRARRTAEAAARLGPSPLTDIVQGFADLAALRGASAEAAFRRALQQESQNPSALLGLGLAEIKQGRLEEGSEQLAAAVVLDPSSSLLRSYLGQAFVEELRDQAAARQLAIAKDLDPTDPTPWAYDAIRLQLTNRPVEALRNIERSIELNENRAEFRSPLLLQQDLAARGASLGRIYEDLGFQQAGALEATRSLALDPTSASAHRFLSDLYYGEPRLELARSSQLLVSQLLSAPSSMPVQPSSPFTDLDVIPATGPLRPSFNEYTALFDRDRIRYTGIGSVGSHDTRSAENIVSGLYGRTSISAGQYYYNSDGYRANNGVRHEIYDVFAQSQLTDTFSMQAEYRYRDTHQGDLSQQFDLDGFSRDLDRDINQNVGRVGAVYRPAPGSTFLANVFVGEREEKVSDLFPTGQPTPPIDTDVSVRARGWSAEAQYLHERTTWNGVFGLGIYPVENRSRGLIDFPFPIDLFNPDEVIDETEHVDQYSTYGYLTAMPNPKLQATAGVSLDTVDGDLVDETRLNPKFGVRYEALPGLTLRGAYFRTLKRQLLFQQTVQPTQVAGFNQLFDDFTGTRASTVALGADGRLPFGLLAGLDGEWRTLDIPANLPTGEVTQQADEWRAGAYLFRTLGEQWALGARGIFDHFELDDDAIGGNDPENLRTWLFPLTARWFHPSGLFAEASATYLYQDIKRGDEATFDDGDDSTWLLGGAVGWRMPERRGLIALQVANLLDSSFKYQDDNFRTNEDFTSPYLPERTVLLRLNLNF